MITYLWRESCYEDFIPFVAHSKLLHLQSLYSFLVYAVFTAESAECRHSTPIRLPAFQSTAGHIASLATYETGWCGTDSSPWLIEVLPGQRINITMLDFGLQSGQVRIAKTTSSRGVGGAGGSRLTSSNGIGISGSPTAHGASGGSCQIRYAVIRERSATGTTPPRMPWSVEVCGGQGAREKHVYLSLGHVIEIAVDARRDNPDYFVLRYEGLLNTVRNAHKYRIEAKKRLTKNSLINITLESEKFEDRSLWFRTAFGSGLSTGLDLI